MINAENRVLLFHNNTEERPDWWFTPGGAIDPGETAEDAVLRELREETGLLADVTAISGPVWTREYEFVWRGKHELHQEKFFLIRVDRHDVDLSGMADEATEISEYRWWSVGEIERSNAIFAPKTLARHLRMLLSGEIPDSPVNVGE